MPLPADLRVLSDRWGTARPAERANAQLYIVELCDALGVEPPRPAGSGYEFELPVKLIARDGTESRGFVDCYKAGHFVLEAKDYEEGRSNDVLLRKAYGQARQYASHDPLGIAPPYILVLDVGKMILVWDRWSGTFGGYPAARRIDLMRLHERPEDIALLVDIWTNPNARDPRMSSQLVTKEIAQRLAELAASLEARQFEQERVARFLMRCVFTMFSEDVGLLPDEPFYHLLDELAIASPDEFPGAAEELWRAMDEGRRFGYRRLLRFNGHFFRDAEALPLTRDDLTTLLVAARADWSRVEPTIFGTLLTRALDPRERHRLGAEFTPPDFIERLVRPTIEVPVRERWTAVQAEVLQLRDSKDAAGAAKSKEKLRRDRSTAEERLLSFHEWLLSLRVLDPACGSGNFLYLAMHAMKRVEVEVLHEIAATRGGALELRMHEVDPSQFYGIEVKPWAREIAELTLWIGFHQFWRLHHGDIQPEEPLLRDTGTLDCRDAVLAWDGEPFEDAARSRADTRRVRGGGRAGGRFVDPTAIMRYMVHANARPADPWPRADFIIGNPPYIGRRKQREALGDGYVDALRGAYPTLSNNADYVMYWWARAAEEVAAGRCIRAGLITTYRITSLQNRPAIESAVEAGAHVVWAIPNHPWVNDSDSAAIRVAMTVLSGSPMGARLVTVDDEGKVLSEQDGARFNTDLTLGVDVAGAAALPLHANVGLCFIGPSLVGRGFVLPEDEGREVLAADPSNREVVHPYWPGNAFASRPTGELVIDFNRMSEEEAREYEVPFEIVRSRVRPERDLTDRSGRRVNWWRFGEPAPGLRAALTGLTRYIGTCLTERHRTFHFVPPNVVTDNSAVCIAVDDPFVLGVLTSEIHRTWARRAGGRLGVGNDPRYNKTVCFDPFPFPRRTEGPSDVARLGESIDAHRRRALSRLPDLDIGEVYALLDATRIGGGLLPEQQHLADMVALGTLHELHDALDIAVAAAYGWQWPIEEQDLLGRLVALHDERISQERAGIVQWLRPAYQIPRYREAPQNEMLALDALNDDVRGGAVAASAWPTDAVGQITALRQLAAIRPVSVDEAVAKYIGAPRDIIARHLETLALLGEVRATENGRFAIVAGDL
jgi:hypothetical protein